MSEKLYGPIGLARTLNIEVYNEGNLLYKGIVDNAPDEIKNLMYKSIKLNGGDAIYQV